MGKVRIAPSGGGENAAMDQDVGEDAATGDIELGNNVYVMPKESAQASHEMNLKTPPKTDASLV